MRFETITRDDEQEYSTERLAASVLMFIYSDVLLQSVAIFVDVEGSVLSRYPLLVFLYAPILSAISNVVDFIVGTSKFVGIEPAQSAC